MGSESASQLEPPADRSAATPDSLPMGPIGRQVFILALPMLGEQFVNFCVGLVDTYLAGQVSKEATAAVGTAAYIGWFVSMAFTLVGTGAAAMVSRSIGSHDRATANRTLNQAFLLGLGLGAIVSVVVYASAPALAAFLTRTPTAREMMTLYLRIDSLSYTLYSALMICAGAVRAAGDTRTPMRIMVVVNIVNTIVSATLVFGWMGEPMGVRGIAIGTVTARSLGGVLIALVLILGLRGLRLQWTSLRPDQEIIRRILRIGIPAAGESTLIWTSQMLFIKIVAFTAEGTAATVNYAAHMIAVRMAAITYLPASAWMTAAGAIVGQYLGAKRPSAAARAGHLAAGQGALLTVGVGIAFYLLAEVIYGVMSNDAAVCEVGPPAFRVMAFFQPFLCVAIIYGGALRGAGDTRTPMIISLIGDVGVRVPIAYLFGVVLGGGLLGAWIGMFADHIVKCMLGCVQFLRGGWKKIRV